jgi:ABC-type Zn uptake system ZnuABC Zn-binding protein ZnuA
VVSGKPIVAYHRSWSYFAQRYGLSVVGFVEPKPGIPPTPAHTLQTIKLIRAQKVRLLLMENFYDDRVPRIIADKSGVGLAVVPNSVGGEEGIETYFDLLDRITSVIEKNVGNPP